MPSAMRVKMDRVNTMRELILDVIYGKFFFLFTAAAALVGYYGMTLFLNWSCGVKWSRDIWPRIKNDPRAVADYFRTVRVVTALLIVAGMWTGATV